MNTFKNSNPTYNISNKLFFSYPPPSGSMWVPLIEKAWAKVIGNYLEADGGIPSNTIHALAGIPVFGYRFSGKKPIKNLYAQIKASDNMNYIFSINVHYETQCGITYGHAYSLMGAFTMKDK